MYELPRDDQERIINRKNKLEYEIYIEKLIQQNAALLTKVKELHGIIDCILLEKHVKELDL